MATQSGLTQVLTNSYQTFSGFVGQVMPNPDVLIKTKGIRFDIFREMMLDGTISGKFEQLFAEVITRKLRIIPKSAASEKQAQFVSDAIKSININRLLSEMLTATQFGFAVQEVVWKDPKKNGGAFLVENIYGRIQERFGFGYDGQLKYSNSGSLEDIPEQYKFIVTRHGFNNENWYGTPITSKCYWSWMFKKAGFRYWVTAAEKFGVPTVIAMFETEGYDENKRDEIAKYLAESLSQIQNDAALALGNVKDIKVLEASGNAQGMFQNFLDICNAEIGKAITGETMTSENGSGSGSFALSNTHADTLEAKGDSIAGEIAATLEGSVVKWITELNFGADAEVPAVVLDKEIKASFADVMTAIDKGVKVSQSALYNDYGLPKPQDENDVFVKTQSSGGGLFGFSDQPKEGEQRRFFADMITDTKQEAINQVNEVEDNIRSISAQSLAEIQRIISDKKDEIFNWDKTPQDLHDAIYNDVYAIATLSNLVGRLHIAELKAHKNLMSDDDVYVYPDQAVKALRKKLNMTREQFDILDEYAKQKAFTAASLANDTLIARLKQVLEENIIDGGSKQDFIQSLNDADLLDSVGLGSNNWYWETVQRTNTMAAYNGGRWQQMWGDRDNIAALEYVDMEGPNECEICSSYGGTILPIDDPFWETCYPINHFNCHCTVRSIYLNTSEADNLEFTKNPSSILPAEGFRSNPGM